MDEADDWEVVGVAAAIAGEQSTSERFSMCTYKKVGENAGLRAALLAVLLKGLACEECGFIWNIQERDAEATQGAVYVYPGWKTD